MMRMSKRASESASRAADADETAVTLTDAPADTSARARFRASVMRGAELATSTLYVRSENAMIPARRPVLPSPPV